MNPILFISTYNRYDYIIKSLDSLFNSFRTIHPRIVLIDDGSENLNKIINLFKDFGIKYTSTFGPLVYYHYQRHIGLPFGKLNMINTTMLLDESEDLDYFLISDSDMIYKPGWIETLVDLYKNTGAPLITGFHTLRNNHKILEEKNNYYIKSSIGGCNLLVDKKFHRKFPFGLINGGVSWDYHMCDLVQNNWSPNIVIASKPSVVDHIGQVGTWSMPESYDKAEDF